MYFVYVVYEVTVLIWSVRFLKFKNWSFKDSDILLPKECRWYDLHGHNPALKCDIGILYFVTYSNHLFHVLLNFSRTPLTQMSPSHGYNSIRTHTSVWCQCCVRNEFKTHPWVFQCSRNTAWELLIQVVHFQAQNKPVAQRQSWGPSLSFRPGMSTWVCVRAICDTPLLERACVPSVG